jgi:hypothetical protein
MDQQEFQTAVLTRLDALEHAHQSSAQMQQSYVQTTHMQFNGIYEQLTGLRDETRQLRDDIRDIRIRSDGDHQLLADVYEARHEVTMTWGWQWAFVSILITIGSVGITQFFTIIILS